MAAHRASRPERSGRWRVRGVRARIIVAWVAVLAIGALVSMLAIRTLLLAQLDERVSESLQQEAQEFERLAGQGVDPNTGRPFGDDVQRLFTVFLQRNVPAEREELVTVPRRGEPRYHHSPRSDQALLADELDPELVARWRELTRAESAELETSAGPARYLAVPVRGGGRPLGSFVVAYFLAAEREEVDDAVRTVAGVLGAVLLAGSMVAFVSAGRLLAPLRDLRDTARSIGETDLTRRIDVTGDDELAELAATFNAMLDRLEQAFTGQRRFARDASHELRTPLTIVRGHLELLRDEPERMSETLTLVTEELDRMSRLVDDLLLLARLERPDFLQLETVDLRKLATGLVAKAETMAPRRWVLDHASATLIVADPQRLTEAVMNLVDNAVRQTVAGDEIAIGSSVDGDRARLWVRDSGPGVAEVDRERIFGRFERGRHGRYEGSGLGLAIVRAIAEAHGGSVALESAAGRGARFEVILPIEPEVGPNRVEPEESEA